MRSLISILAISMLALGALTACNSADSRSSGPKPCSGPLPADGVCRVTVTELKDLLANNEAIVIDVRNQASYDQAHIRGSKLIPEAEVANHIEELPKNKLVVTYCS